MEKIVIYQKRQAVVNGVTTYTTTKVDLASQEPFIVATSMVVKSSIMSDDYVSLNVVSKKYLQFLVGDYCVVQGRKYEIRSMADVVRKGTDQYEYAITMYGAMYDLIKRQFRNTDVYGRSSTATFDLTYTLGEFMNVIVNNMNRGVQSDNVEWFCGQSDTDDDLPNFPETEPKTISFSCNNCLTALQMLCGESYFDCEFRIEQSFVDGRWKNVLYVGQFDKTPVNTKPFEYGAGRGLYQLKECKVDDATIINRLWAEGGSENVRSSYRGYAGRLQLPLRRKNRYRHVFPDGSEVAPNTDTIGIVDDNCRFVQDQELVDRYGLLEETWQTDEIHPSFTGEVFRLGTNPRLQFLAHIGFDLNATWHQDDDDYSAFWSDYSEWCYINGYFKEDQDDYERFCLLRGYADDYHAYLTQHGYTEEQVSFSNWVQLIGNRLIAEPASFTAFWSECTESANTYINSVAGTTKYLIDSSTPAQVTFIDGKLAGCQFDVQSNWSQVTIGTEVYGLFTIVPYNDETETTLPSEDSSAGRPFRFAVGDKFKLTNIFMPYEYYVRAEEDLWYSAVEQLENVKQPSYKYELTFDPIFVKVNKGFLQLIKAGDYITIKDRRFFASNDGFCLSMRVTSVEYDVLTMENYKLTLENVHKLRKNKIGNNWHNRMNEIDIMFDVCPELRSPQYRSRSNRTSASVVGSLSSIQSRVGQLVTNMNVLTSTFNGKQTEVCSDGTCCISATIHLEQINN